MTSAARSAPTIADDPAMPTVDRKGRAKPLPVFAAILIAMTYRNSSATVMSKVGPAWSANAARAAKSRGSLRRHLAAPTRTTEVAPGQCPPTLLPSFMQDNTVTRSLRFPAAAGADACGAGSVLPTCEYARSTKAQHPAPRASARARARACTPRRLRTHTASLHRTAKHAHGGDSHPTRALGSTCADNPFPATMIEELCKGIHDQRDSSHEHNWPTHGFCELSCWIAGFPYGGSCV